MQSLILTELRSATRQAHDRLDAELPFMSDALEPRQYVELLAGWHSIHAAANLALAPHTTALRDFGYDATSRSETAWLEQDIQWWRAHGVPSTNPHRGKFPALDSVGAAFGCVYVLEGSTLGGQVILRHIRKTLGLEPPHGCRFLVGYGRGTGPRWRRTCGALDAFAASRTRPDGTAELSDVTTAACDVFAAVEERLKQAAE